MLKGLITALKVAIAYPVLGMKCGKDITRTYFHINTRRQLTAGKIWESCSKDQIHCRFCSKSLWNWSNIKKSKPKQNNQQSNQPNKTTRTHTTQNKKSPPDIKQSLSFKRVNGLIDHEDDRQLSPWKNLMPDKMMDIVIDDTKGLWQVNKVSLSHYMIKTSLWLFRQTNHNSLQMLHL